MEVQWMFDALLSFVAFLGGWVLKLLHGEVNTLKEDLKKLPDTYARKDDMRDKFELIQNTLIRIETKLDGKKDKTDV